MAKVILHIDLNYFFVRCEEIRKPSLEGMPVAIGHAGRAGVISTCSYKAREYGVHSGMPSFKALQLCKNLILINGDYEYYSEKSHEFFRFLRKYAKLIEPASVDECYVDITEEIKNKKNPLQYIYEIQSKLYEETKLMCSIGVSTTKFLAKMGSDLKKPMGITVIRKKDIPTLLYPLKIEDFFGIGKKTAPRLRAIGVNTIGDLAKRIENDDQELKDVVGKFYYGIKDMITGNSDDVVSTEEWDPKSISHSHTLDHDTNDEEEIYQALKVAAREVSKHAKEERKVGKTVQLILKDNSFKSYVRSMRIKNKSNEYIDIYTAAIKLYEKHFLTQTNVLFRLVGIGLQGLENEENKTVQFSIFDNYDEIDEKCATEVLIQEINQKMKGGYLKTAKEAMEEKKWK